MCLDSLAGLARLAADFDSHSTQTFHRQDRKDRKELPTLIMSEELPDQNLPDHVSEFSRVSALNMGGFFAGFACFAVKLHCLG